MTHRQHSCGTRHATPSWLALAAALYTGILLPAWAESPQSRATSQLLQNDVRLRERVSLAVGRSPLGTLLGELGRKISVSIRAAPDVADEPAMLYVTDKPASTVMQQLATLFNFQWRLAGSTAPRTYELYQDIKSKQEEEALRTAERLRAVQGLQSAIHERAAMVQRTPATLEREADQLAKDLRTHDTGTRTSNEQVPTASYRTPELAGSLLNDESINRLRQMAVPLHRALFHVVRALSSNQWNLLLQGFPIVFSTQKQKGTFDFPSDAAEELRSAPPTRDLWPTPTNIVSPVDALTYQESEERRREAWASAAGYHVIVWLQFSSDAFNFLDFVSSVAVTQDVHAVLNAVPIADMPATFQGLKPEATGLTISSHEVLAAQGPDEAVATTKESDTLLEKAERDAAKRSRAFNVEPSAPRDDIPWLQAPALTDVVPAIAETFGINIVADAYRPRRVVLPPGASRGEQTLRQVLDEYVRPLAHWKVEAPFLQIRSSTWYSDRLSEIPQRTVTYWVTRLKQQKFLSLKDVVELVLSLRDEQLEQFESVMRFEGLQFTPGSLRRAILLNKEILRGYGQLPPRQRQAVEKGNAVPCMSMPMESRRQLVAALATRQQLDPEFTRRRYFDANVVPSVDLSTSRLDLLFFRNKGLPSPGTSYMEAVFRLRDDSREGQVVWSIFMPNIIYEQPRTHKPTAATGSVPSTAATKP
jgi:hypothetical protein